MKFFKSKYRIVTDKYSGYEVQRKLWFSPFYFMLGINTNPSIERAEEWLKSRFFSKKIVKDLGYFE